MNGTNINALKIEHGILQRQYDRAIDAHNRLYDRINMSLVLVAAPAGFAFLSPGFPERLAGSQDAFSLWAKTFFVMSVTSYEIASLTLIYAASNRATFSSTHDIGRRKELSEVEILEHEADFLSEAISLYGAMTRKRANAWANANILIGIGIVYYAIHYWLMLRATGTGGGT